MIETKMIWYEGRDSPYFPHLLSLLAGSIIQEIRDIDGDHPDDILHISPVIIHYMSVRLICTYIISISINNARWNRLMTSLNRDQI